MNGLPQAASTRLTFEVFKDSFRMQRGDRPLPLSEKWAVFYTLLAVNTERYISTDEVCDHHPWNRLTPEVAGRDLWRFTQRNEIRHFGRRISTSPSRQATKLFSLTPEAAELLEFRPDQLTVADQLRSLRRDRHEVALELSECNLMLHGGLVAEALRRLELLRQQPLNINDLAHTETLITMCLDELHGTGGTRQQVEVLSALLNNAQLSRKGRARLLVRLARHSTLSADYAAALGYFTQLRPLVTPEDTVEFGWYHINLGLYLRRTGQLEQALHHMRLAHDVAQGGEWWRGVQSARYNLALIHLSLAECSPPLLRQRHMRQALEWVRQGYAIVVLTHQPNALVETHYLIGAILRELNELDEARYWLSSCLTMQADTQQNFPTRSQIHLQLMRLEQAAGNYFWSSLHQEKQIQAAQQERQVSGDV